jgi:hypothetical protein
MKRENELTMDGGRAFRLRKEQSSMEESCNGATCPLPNLLEINSEHNDRHKQTKKRRVKLKWLIRNIPRGGAKAPERLNPR